MKNKKNHNLKRIKEIFSNPDTLRETKRLWRGRTGRERVNIYKKTKKK